MSEHPPRAREIVDQFARPRDLLVGEKPPGRVVEWRTTQKRQVGVAIVVNFLDVVLEFVSDQRRVISLQLRVPVLGRKLSEAQKFLMREVVAHEMGLDIEDELSGQALRAR